MGVGRLLSSHNGRMTIILDYPKWNPTTANPFGKIVLSRSHRPVMCCPMTIEAVSSNSKLATSAPTTFLKLGWHWRMQFAYV